MNLLGTSNLNTLINYFNSVGHFNRITMQLQNLTAQSACTQTECVVFAAISVKLDNDFLLPGYFCHDHDLRK